MEECLAQWTTPAKVRAGWQMARSVIIDNDQILRRCSKWAQFENEESRELVQNVVDNPAMQHMALRRYVNNPELDVIICDTLARVINIDPAALKVNTLSSSLCNSCTVQSRFETRVAFPPVDNDYLTAIMMQIRRKFQRNKLMRY
jgi:hypothetical protein